MLVSVRENTRQRFANLRVGWRRIKKKKRKEKKTEMVLRTIFTLSIKKRSKKLYLAISI